MKCIKCNSQYIVEVSAKCNDLVTLMSEKVIVEGYKFPYIGLGNNTDYIEFNYCLNCGQMQGEYPMEMPEELVVRLLGPEEDDEDLSWDDEDGDDFDLGSVESDDDWVKEDK